MSSRSITLRDSEGIPLKLMFDDQGDIYLQARPTILLPNMTNCVRFCGPGGDGGYARNTKRALRELAQAMLLDGAAEES